MRTKAAPKLRLKMLPALFPGRWPQPPQSDKGRHAYTFVAPRRRIGHDPDTSPTTPGMQRVSAYTCQV
jgi:hypothetical protein